MRKCGVLRRRKVCWCTLTRSLFCVHLETVSPSFLRLESATFRTRVDVVVLTICYPSNCADVILASSKTTTVGSTKMLKTKEEEDEVGGFHYSAKYSAQLVLGHSRYSCSEGLI